MPTGDARLTVGCRRRPCVDCGAEVYALRALRCYDCQAARAKELARTRALSTYRARRGPKLRDVGGRPRLPVMVDLSDAEIEATFTRALAAIKAARRWHADECERRDYTQDAGAPMWRRVR